MLYEREAMNFATRKLIGVSTITISVIQKFLENMNTSVAATVTTPEKSCVKPSSSPSDKIPVSAMTRLTMSPVLCRSRYESGSFWMCRIACARRSCTMRYVMRLFRRLITHEASAETATTIRTCRR